MDAVFDGKHTFCKFLHLFFGEIEHRKCHAHCGFTANTRKLAELLHKSLQR